MTDRVIVLVDMDCFYCQVETKLNPSLAGKPVAVVQYNAWKGGGIIAVNYEARDKGVTRFMRGDDATAVCPEIQLVSVPTVRDKADLTKYRDASRDVIAVLCTYSDCVERASIDEAYLDLTESIKSKRTTIEPFHISNSFVVGYSKEKCNDESERESGTAEWLKDIYTNGFDDEAGKNLAIAAKIVEEIRAEVFQKTGFRCSAGIAHNKILAKLACGLHKPNRQTILPHCSVPHLYKTLSVKKVRHLGGKLGDLVMEKLDCTVMADLLKYSEKELKSKFDDKNGSWLYNIARGIDKEPVTSRLIPKSIGCCKRFPGKTSLKTKEDITYWLNQLVQELVERVLEDHTMNKRKAQLLTVSMTLPDHQAVSKSLPLSSYDHEKIYNSAFVAVRKICSNSKEETWIPVYCLGLSASKFSDLPSSGAIQNYFHSNPSRSSHLSSKPIKQETAKSPTPENKSPTNSFFSKFIRKDGCEAANACPESIKCESNVVTDSDNVAFLNCDSCSQDSSDRSVKLNGSVKENLNLSAEKMNSLESNAPLMKKTLRQGGSVKSFFSKVDLPGREDDSNLISKKKDKSIKDFLKNHNEYEAINPLDVFPDLNAIDDELLQSFPISFRRKVLALKKESEMNSVPSFNPDNSLENSNSPSVGVGEENINNNGEIGSVTNQGFSTDVKDYEGDDIFDESNDEPILNIRPTGKVSEYFQPKLETCPECGGNFEANDLPEHLDFHVAQKISLEINSAPQTHTSTNAPSKTISGNPVKRKQSGRGKQVSETKKFKTLKKFFIS